MKVAFFVLQNDVACHFLVSKRLGHAGMNESMLMFYNVNGCPEKTQSILTEKIQACLKRANKLQLNSVKDQLAPHIEPLVTQNQRFPLYMTQSQAVQNINIDSHCWQALLPTLNMIHCGAIPLNVSITKFDKKAPRESSHIICNSDQKT